MAERELKVGTPIIFVDARGVQLNALVTVVWGQMNGPEPGCNLVFVTPDEDRRDPYGRQIDRATSVVHKSAAPAHGYYWRWPDEEPLPYRPPTES